MGSSYGVVTSTLPALEPVEQRGGTTGPAGAVAVGAAVAAGIVRDGEGDVGKGERGVRGVTTRDVWYAGAAGVAGVTVVAGRRWSASWLPESMT